MHLDAVEALLVSGAWRPPIEGDRVVLPDGAERKWKQIHSASGGLFEDRALFGGYAAIPVELPEAATFVLEASGHSLLYVNGAPRAGDPYETGTVRIPVRLPEGHSDLLFACGRGHLRVALRAADASAWIDPADATLPDVVRGETGPLVAGIVVANAGDAPLRGASIVASIEGEAGVATPVPTVPAESVRKIPVNLPRTMGGASAHVAVSLRLVLTDGQATPVPIQLRVRSAHDTINRTFVSEIDGSVQYYAVRPASGDGGALVLSLHGASVQATGQADAYSPKPWCTIVAPTNRRPYGFDWEDWGRLDGMEVLDRAIGELHPDPSRIYLTGHSMGGHGSWHLGVTYPDRFAAVGPSAGWISFWTYSAGRRPDPRSDVEAMLQRAASPSDTLALASNLESMGVYILHGDKDDNVPVEQARHMRDALSKFHHDLQYHEQPGAGHWWESSDEPGAECLDWAPMFDLFAHRRLPGNGDTRRVSFRTASPGVSSECWWAAVEAQQHPFKVSAIEFSIDPFQRRFTGTTDNVLRLRLDTGVLRGDTTTPVRVELDGVKLDPIPAPVGGTHIWLVRSGDVWAAAPPPSPDVKGPARCGPFKDAFRHRPILIYGTRGNDEETIWACNKARYDAETFWYRGNGSLEVMADTGFDPAAEPDRSVILYGNADTNGAWTALLGDAPVVVGRGRARLGDRTWAADDLACLYIRPRPGSAVASVGVIAGTGLAGMRLTDRLPYFVSGVAYPDFTLMSTETLRSGVTGVLAAGFFGPDWGVISGEFAFRADAPASPPPDPAP